MKLWILKPILDDAGMAAKPWRDDPYCSTWGLVVRAATESEARALAMTVASGLEDSGYGDALMTSCAELTVEGPAEVIIDNTGTG